MVNGNYHELERQRDSDAQRYHRSPNAGKDPRHPGEGGRARYHRFCRLRGRRPPAPKPDGWTQRTSRRGRVALLPGPTCRVSGPLHPRCHGPLARIDAADTGREGDRATSVDNLVDRLVLDEPIDRLPSTYHIVTAPRTP